MPLRSKLFRGDQRLEACLVSDPAHILQGAAGPHVGKIQKALTLVDGATIDQAELSNSRYGPSTAAAVLAFKTRRGIINRAYQTKPDAIVGKMTIAALDEATLAKEILPTPGLECRLFCACPVDVDARGLLHSNMMGFSNTNASRSAMGFAAVGAPAAASSDASIMAEALRASRASLGDARGDLMSVTAALRANQPLVPAQDNTFRIAAKWLNLNTADKPACITHMDTAIALMLRNLNLTVTLSHAAGERYHALSNLNRPDLGLKCGDPFFSPDGPNCRRDVVTHEFFHMVGVTHGGGSLMGPTIRSAITTPAQALDSADNLAQLVAEQRTFKTPNTDACTRAGD